MTRLRGRSPKGERLVCHAPHGHWRTIALIEQAGAEVRFLPAYSPDLNPIQMMWSKV